MISVIAAMDRNRLIGTETGLPWHLPNDLKLFRQITDGKAIVMGRRTWDILGRPLPGRLNIVLSRDPQFAPTGCQKADSIAEAISVGESYNPEVMIIGGAIVFEQALPICDRLYLTTVQGEFAGNSYFPADWRQAGQWNCAKDRRFPADAKNAFPFRFQVFDKVCSPVLPSA